MAQQLLRHVDTFVTIAGQQFPVVRWSTSLANQGSMATANAEGSLGDLVSSGLDIIEACQDPDGAEFEIYGGYDGDSQLLFTGVVDSVDLDWDSDKFEVRGRDHSASFADGRQTVARLEYRNQTIGQIVQQIADQFGFDAEIRDADVMAGPLMNGEHSFNPHPQSYWSLLQSMAETIGNECYMKPDQTLYFGPEETQNSVTVNYGAPPGSGAENPGWGLTAEYNPRNNSNIVVKALSVNPQTTQQVSATARARQVRLGKGRKVRSALKGSQKQPQSHHGSSGATSKPKSTYYIRCAGMTEEQAQRRCQAMADNLAKHQIILGCSIEGLPELKIHSEVTLVESGIDLYGFANIPLNVSEVTHSFSMPQGTDSSGGFVTHFRAIAQVEE